MVSPEEARQRLADLLADYEAQLKANPNTSEADVEAGFVARFFEIIGWDKDHPRIWNRQVFIRGAGYADVGLQIDNQPVIFLEAKRFGKLAPTEAAVAQKGLWGDDVILSLTQRQANHIDRTPEERQAIRYARARGVRWAILTNFERLVLFDADREHFAANRQFLENLPIRQPRKRERDRRSGLAQRMLDLNRASSETTRIFAETLRGYERGTASLWSAYVDHSEYSGAHLTPHSLVDANETGTVSAIAVDESDSGLLIRVEIESEWRDLARLEIQNEDFRLFLLLALRQFIHENRRKRAWVKNKPVYRGVLSALEVPVLNSQIARANFAQIARLMNDVRARLDDVKQIHLSRLEQMLRETDQQLDALAHELYGLTEAEIAVVKG